jgi:hypothetical protein
MNDPKLPPFEDAVARLRAFLASEGFKTDIIWICREDVFQQWPKLYVKVPLSNEKSLAEETYNEGVTRGLGVELSVFCFVAGSPCCYVWIPKDEIDAEYRMLGGLKLTIPKPDRQTVVPVKSKTQWIWLKLWSSRHLQRSWVDDIPQKQLVEIAQTQN